MSQDPLHIVCIEPRFPGRLGGVADWLVRCRGYRATFFCHSAEPVFRRPVSTGQGLDVIAYNVGGIAKEGTVAWTRVLERGLCHAYGAWEVLDARRVRPVDAILGRSDSLGSSLFAPVSHPNVPVVQYFDYYFQAHEHDLADEAGDDTPIAFHHWRRSANAIELIDLESGVHPWTATNWQRSLFPAEYRDEFFVLHDGVDYRLFQRREGTSRVVAGRTIPSEAKIVTFVARSPDRLRGFDRFLDVVDALQRDDPNLIAIAVGDPEVVHSLDFLEHGRDYSGRLIRERPVHDPGRLWRIGSASPGLVAQVLALSDLHLAPGRVYPVARSAIEAMSAGAPVIATDTAPAREIFESGVTAMLAPPEGLIDAARRVLGDVEQARSLGAAGAASVRERFSRDACLPRLAERLQALVEGRIGAQAPL